MDGIRGYYVVWYGYIHVSIVLWVSLPPVAYRRSPRPDTITHKFHEYYKEAGIEGANVHSLRKTFGSLLLQNGKADLYTVSKLLGHTSIRTTEKYYVDLLDENYRSSVQHLEDILPIISYEENA